MSDTVPGEQLPAVGVLDIPMRGERRLTDTVRACGHPYHEVRSIDELIALIRSNQIEVAVAAFAALWPRPQRTLRRIRSEGGTSTRLLIAHADDTPRLRLGKRLWATGLFDYFLPRSMPPYELRPILRQTHTEVLLERSAPAPAPDTEGDDHGLRRLHGLCGALLNQSSVEMVLRELQTKLPELVAHRLLQVLVLDPLSGHKKLYVVQSGAVEYRTIWTLAEQLCEATEPFSESSLRVEDLIFAHRENTFAPEQPDGQTVDDALLALPLVQSGELIGAFGLACAEGPLSEQLQMLLRLVSFQLASALRNAQTAEAALREAVIDPLTGAHNRRHMTRVLDTEWRRTRRYCLNLSVAMLDIDNLKGLNERHGHLVGDAVLQSVVNIVSQKLRETDHLIRFGGEEFLLILPQTNASEAALVLERLRLVLRRHPVYRSEHTGRVQVTFSAGIAATPGCSARSADHLVDLADRALLLAKQSGGNRVCVASNAPSGTRAGVIDSSRDPETDKRGSPRLSAPGQVRYIPLPELEDRAIHLPSRDISAGGVGVEDPRGQLKHGSYALVMLEDDPEPLLSKVVWTRDLDGGERVAGLSFVSGGELESVVTAGYSTPDQHRALIIADRPATRRMVDQVLHAAHYTADLVESAEDISGVDLSRYRVIIVGETALRGGIGAELQRSRQQGQIAGRVVLINESDDRDHALRAIHSTRIEHLVGGSAAWDALFATLTKLVVGDFFGIKKYLLWGSDSRQWSLYDSDQKARVLDGVRRFAKDVGCHPRITDLLVTAVDEMVVNALFHPENRAQKRRPVTVELGSDSRFLAVAVIDEHGLFEGPQLFRSVGRALEVESKGLQRSAVQASLGFRIMLTALTQLAVNVDPGRRTEIIGIVDLRKSVREYRRTAPSLGLFSTAPDRPSDAEQVDESPGSGVASS